MKNANFGTFLLVFLQSRGVVWYNVLMDLVRLAPRMLCGGCLPDKPDVERTKFEKTSAVIHKS